MLIRFRACRVPVIADVEKAFLMVGIEEDDRDVCKFLWVRDPFRPVTTDNLVTYRFRRLAFGLTPSPFCLATVVRHHLRKYDSNFAKELIRDTYVDNVLIPADTAEEAAIKGREAKRMFADARMNLREFLSNDETLNNSFSDAEFLGKTTAKVLGLEWNAETDKIRMKYPGSEPGTPISTTRRTVLSSIASLFDPLGLVCPATLKAKLFFQKLWDDNHEWDTPLSREEAREWEHILASWEGESNAIPRGVTAGMGHPLQLHVFTDASEIAYAAAAYIRTGGTSGYNSRLIMVKSRLKPKKAAATFTIPRMELMGILLGVRLAAFIKKQLHHPIAEQHIWSDSMIALHWVKTASPQPQFVANRLFEIRKAIATTFHYVRTNENPADLATRGEVPTLLQHNDHWCNGPQWLCGPRTEWPNELEFQPDQEGLPSPAWQEEGQSAFIVRNEAAPGLESEQFPSSLLTRCSRWKEEIGLARTDLKQFRQKKSGANFPKHQRSNSIKRNSNERPISTTEKRSKKFKQYLELNKGNRQGLGETGRFGPQSVIFHESEA